MSKQTIINQIAAELNRLGVPFRLGQGADLTINNEFVDASWGTGSKRIVYEASLLIDEQNRIANFWEKTIEIGGGLSMGYNGESSFQSGSTLFRKVIFKQMGPGGQRVDVSLDLGSIARSVKSAVNTANWRFKTVLSKAKASYPDDKGKTAPSQPAGQRQAFCTECGKPIPQGARFCPNCGKPHRPF